MENGNIKNTKAKGFFSEPETVKKLVCISVSFMLLVVLLVLEKRGCFEELNRLCMIAIWLVPYLIVGYDVIIDAAGGIFEGELFDEDLLMLIAGIAALAIGEFSEAVTVMLLFNVGELFEDYANDKSKESIGKLMDIKPEHANLIVNDGSIMTVQPESVASGSLLLVKPGEKIPVDGVVVEGAGYVDCSGLTGESMPVAVAEGSRVFGGSINGQESFKMRTSCEYSNSTAAKIADLIENASTNRSSTERFITKFASVYTPAVTIAAIILAAAGSLITGNPAEWIRRACTFLVISCPCALVISVPLSYFGGIGAASREGIMVKGGSYITLASKIDTVCFDKTGTLTGGIFKVSEIIVNSAKEAEAAHERENENNKEKIIRLAAALEKHSTHPVAEAVNSYYGDIYKCPAAKAEAVKEIPGMGLSGMLEGKELLAGNERLMSRYSVGFEPVNTYGTVIYVAYGRKYLGAVVVRDSIKENAEETLQNLKKLGIGRTVMLTGDVESVAEDIAGRLGIDSWFAGLLPQNKVEKIEELQNKDKAGSLAFVGDGINDAPVLLKADLGIAMGSLGSDAAIEAADVVIMNDDIGKLADLVRISRKTMRIVRENIILALSVKLITLVLGGFGIEGIELAVFADVGVAIIAILNAMRTLK